MFLFFPKSEKDLKNNGYKYNSEAGFYSKVIGDTSESIREFNKDSSFFSKHFYIKTHSDNIDTVLSKIDNISRFIVANSSQVIFSHDYWKLLKIDRYYFFVIFGFSSKRTFCLIQYYNLRNSSDRNYCVKYLQSHLEPRPDSNTTNEIYKAIEYIKTY